MFTALTLSVAVQTAGRVIYGNNWLPGFTPRQRDLMNLYPSGGPEPDDPPTRAEISILRGRDRLMTEQHDRVLQWLRSCGFRTEAGARVDRAAFEEAVARDFPEFARIPNWSFCLGEQAAVSSRTAGGIEMLEDDDDHARKRQREKWRRDWIAKFADRQRIARRWIAFVDLADWGAHSTKAASADAEEQARELVYRRLSESVLKSAFEQAGRSKILYLDPHVTLDGASTRCRLTREQFDIAFEIAATPPAPALPIPVLSRCWLPREVARHWLEAHGYKWSPHFEPPQKQATASAIRDFDIRVGWIPVTAALAIIEAVVGDLAAASRLTSCECWR